jgi:glyoxylase-like metal-dependent hydrolase (beta-lactamase superfamily II)
MQIKLQFLGAAQNVTGSRHLLSANGVRVLVDCGLYQERQLIERNWAQFSVEPASINAVLLTHAHLDHCGLLPKLAREGFAGKIYCTADDGEWNDIPHENNFGAIRFIVEYSVPEPATICLLTLGGLMLRKCRA